MGQQQRVEEIVGDDDRGPVGQHLPQHPAEQGGGADIQGGQRFVEQQQTRVCGQGTGDRHPLGLTPGQLCGLPGGELGCFDLLQPAPSGAAGLRGALAGGLGPESDVVENAQMREQQRILGQQGHPAVPGRQPPAGPARSEIEQGLSVDLGASGVGPQHTGEDRQQGGLAGAVRSEQRDPFPGVELEVDVEVPGGERGPHGDASRCCPVIPGPIRRRPPPRRPGPATTRPRHRRRFPVAGRSPAARSASHPAGCRRTSAWRRTRRATGRTTAPPPIPAPAAPAAA